MKICPQCSSKHISRYKLCSRCYNKNWLEKKEAIPCPICKKIFKTSGAKCAPCSRKIRDEKKKDRPCSQCHRSNVKIKIESLMLCTTCHRKKLEEEVEGYKEKRILYNRQSHRKYRGKDPHGPLRKKPAGAGYINVHGYNIITKVGHPNANSDKGAIAEHIFVMSEYLKRPLKKGETVHHKNGIRHDNRIENLELWHKSQPCGQRVEDKIVWCKEFLEFYGYRIIDP